MGEAHQNRLTLFFTAVSEFAAVFVFSVGGLVLAGWFFDIAVFKSALPGLVTMKANTALCFSLVGLSLWLLQTKRINPGTQIFARLCLLLNFVISGLTIYEYVWGVNLGIDEFLVKEDAGAVLTTNPGRMAVNTAVCFVLASMTLFFLDVKTSRGFYPAQFAAAAGWMISTLAMIGYFYGIKFLYYGAAQFTVMAVHTAAAFFVFFAGVFFARLDGVPASLFTRSSLGGMIARRLIPVTLIAPPVFGWLKLWGERSGVIPNEVGVSFVATANMMVISICVLWLVLFIDGIDADRRKKEEILAADEEQLRAINQQLRANEQQLRANEQQLRANEHQLRASNQELMAAQRQLRATNEHLLANEKLLHAEIESRKRTEETTQKHLHELQVFYTASTGREERILELKERIAQLEEELKKR